MPKNTPPSTRRTEGSHALALTAAKKTLGISLPTVWDALVGSTSHEKCDARLQGWAQDLIGRTETTVEITGLENVPDAPCVIMSNHQSYADIPLLYYALPHRVRIRMVAKRELFFVPIWGRAMRASGFIPIERADRKKAIAAIDQAKQQIHAGTWVWIAPEGTRSRTAALGPLKKGGFILARDTDVPILPVCLDGTWQIMPPQRFAIHRRSHVRITISPLVQSRGRELTDVMADVARLIDPATHGSPILPG